MPFPAKVDSLPDDATTEQIIDRLRADVAHEKETFRAMGVVYIGGDVRLLAADRLEQTQEIVKAQKEGRITIRACNIGADAWFLDRDKIELHKMRVHGISINYNNLTIYHLGHFCAVSEKQLDDVWFLSEEAGGKALSAERKKHETHTLPNRP